MNTLQNQLLHFLAPSLFLNNDEYTNFLNLVKTGRFTKDTNSEHHCCVFFIPYKPQTKEIFIVHHKKAKQWVVPGGHVEQGELLEDAVKREAQEELGMSIENVGKPFLFSVMHIHNDGQKCKAHYDIWYLVPITEALQVDLTEFNDVKWVTIAEAQKLITHATYLLALDKLEMHT